MDVMEDPPDNNLYNNLKDVLTSRHSMSLERRIKKLISDEEIGDRRPSEFFRHLKQLAGSAATPGEEFIMELWLSCVPHVINIALISQNVQDIQTLLIWDATQDARSVVARIASKSEELINQNKMANLQEEICSLKKIIAELKIQMLSIGSREPVSQIGLKVGPLAEKDLGLLVLIVVSIFDLEKCQVCCAMQAVGMANSSVSSRSSRVFIKDRENHLNFLIDAGADLSGVLR
ncbi:uncharacterized protein LOC129615789 [Condylostylus longicornis]|uniref:uncharacterized protein LOC129615789 n=1 Tax=Condylostylus longicornis TaxID=2530218 RepID=UPI00244DF50B|nr:uncharacterized protein LOC129615789 [Condylostylus longicornis]